MDQNKSSSDQQDELKLYKPDDVVTSDQAGSETTVLTTQSPLPIINDRVPKSKQLKSKVVNQSKNITWTASEFIAHSKSIGWYAMLVIGAIILGAIVWLLTKDDFSTALVIIGVLLLGVYASHKPRQVTYAVDEQGLTIGDSHHSFNEFRSFSVVSEGAFSSIELTPFRRFAMYSTIYFDPADEEKIIGVMSNHMPMEEPRNDLVDQLMRRIRF
ncbi:MAG: hypothetical protein ACREF5_01515 [Candidatus Saccharimonadales bacterium]